MKRGINYDRQDTRFNRICHTCYIHSFGTAKYHKQYINTNFAVNVFAVTVGSLIPDIDKPGSTITRDIAGPFGASRIMSLIGGIGLIFLTNLLKLPLFFLLAGVLLLVMACLKHRGITHSIFGLILACYTITILQVHPIYQQYVGIPIFRPFTIGYTAHLIADFCTNRGIAPFYPIIKKRVKMPLVTVRTGSMLDKVVINYLAFGIALFHII